MAEALRIRSGTKLRMAFDAPLGKEPEFNLICTFVKSQDTATFLISIPMREGKPLPLDVRSGRNDVRTGRKVLGEPLPIVKGPRGARHLDVRDDGEHPVAHLFLKAVHDGEHDDESRDAEGDRRDGHRRNKR